MNDELKSATQRLEQSVIDQMIRAAGQGHLGELYAIELAEVAPTVGEATRGVKLCVKSGEHLRLIALQDAPPPALLRALLQSKLVEWYLCREPERPLKARLEGLPWPKIPRDLGDQLEMLMLYRDQLDQEERSTQGIERSIERVIVELYGLSVEHLMTLDLIGVGRNYTRY